MIYRKNVQYFEKIIVNSYKNLFFSYAAAWHLCIISTARYIILQLVYIVKKKLNMKQAPLCGKVLPFGVFKPLDKLLCRSTGPSAPLQGKSLCKGGKIFGVFKFILPGKGIYNA
jgi:hypothetical protein